MKVRSIQEAVNAIFAHFSQNRNLRLATPLGLGKPNQLVNAIYEHVEKNDAFTLDIFTALSLDLPDPKPGLESRFAKPFIDRHFGPYPRLLYLKDIREGRLSPRINVEEFYLQAGRSKDLPYVQQSYVALNYTHVVRRLVEKRVNIVLQLVAKSGDRYSLSCNTDLTLDFLDATAAAGQPCLFVGVVHPDLPFVSGDAELPESAFQLILESTEINHELFALPRGAIDIVDHAIGLQASQLVVDDGSLQIGIGSLSDALVNALILRQKDNAQYRKILGSVDQNPSKDGWQASLSRFEKGLYGTSEMIMDGFMHLRKNGILTRVVRDHQRDIYVHGAFYLGSKEFYDWLRHLSEEDFRGFAMTRVSKVNDLYDADETLLRRQRKNARFFNTCMNVTLLGGAASDTLPDGRVISGVGGQYNFVAMSHELPDARSVLMLRSTAVQKGKRRSNIVWSHGHLTIPRHLRDIVVTEYGVASIRGKSDREVILELLAITDAEFQEELFAIARKHGKLSAHDRIPECARQNTKQNLEKKLRPFESNFASYPFGSDFTELELRIMKALGKLKTMTLPVLLKTAIHGLLTSPETYQAELERMNFTDLNSVSDRFRKKLLMGILRQTDKRAALRS